MTRPLFLSIFVLTCGVANASHPQISAPQINPLVDMIRAGMPRPEPCCGASHWIHALPPRVASIAHRLAEEPPVETPGAPPAAPPVILPEPQDERHRRDLAADVELGKEVALQVAKEMKFTQKQNLVERVRRIGAELAEIANRTQVEVTWGDRRLNPFIYEFNVLEGPDVNAFSLPGGFIYVYEGLVQQSETDDELAGVLAHEIAHASFRHVATLQREQSRVSAITLPLVLISLLSGGQAGLGAAQVTSLAQQAVGSGWSVRAEQSADFGGFQYLRRSRYHPVGLLTFMERLAYQDRANARIDWGIFRSHPPSRERVTALRALMRGANVPIRRSVSSTTLRVLAVEESDGAFTLRVMGRTIGTLYGPEARARAEAAAERMTVFLDRVPAVFEVTNQGTDLRGSGDTLVTFIESDSLKTGRNPAEMAAEASRLFKAAVFELGFRIWEN